ncbi:hypothetical protein WJX73_004032 [Symbiochloris irregularis]|uniref:C3H1-type domain-containing protein n=1 Tax=Symbiochloris irregularis TaxID=706552 RepID=A0AAW1NIG5_9CHLO
MVDLAQPEVGPASLRTKGVEADRAAPLSEAASDHDLSNFDAQDSQNSRTRNSPICYDFVKKQCTRGAECRYSHDLESIVNSTRGRHIPAVRHNPLASSSYSWAYAPPSIYQQQNMAMAAMTHPWGPQHSMLLASLPGVPGAIEAMAVPYGSFSAAAGAYAAYAAPADMEALKAMATAAADPRNGHVVQAQILQQMQSMLSLMQQQQQRQPAHHPALPHRHRAVHPAVAAMTSNSAYADSPSAAQAPAFPAANAARPFTNSSAWHSPALAGVARQIVAEATPQQTSSSLNVNAAVFMAESPSDGIGAYWNAHGDHHEELVADGGVLRHSKESMLALHNQMPGRRLSNEHAHTAVDSTASCRTSMPELELDLHARGELPAMRTASPEAFRRTLDASRRKLSPAASLHEWCQAAAAPPQHGCVIHAPPGHQQQR